MRILIAAAAVTLATLSFASSAQAITTTYATRAAFDLANPGLTFIDFAVCGCGTVAFTGPLSSAGAGPFAPGNIPAGITFNSSTNDLFTAGPGQSSNPDTALGQNSPSSVGLEITFAPTITSLGFNIFQNFGGGAQSGSDQIFPVTLFGPGNVLLDVINITVPSGGAGFFGVSSTDPIALVSVNNAAAFDVINLLEFGGVAAAPIPEPGTLALLGTGLAGLFVARRRRKAKA